MVSRVFQATRDNPIQNDFVNSCKKYLDSLEIELDFDDIRKMSRYAFKKLVKGKTTEAGFKYLMKKKNEKGKQMKIENLEYSKLSLQEYLLCGSNDIEISKLIFKTRGQILDIKEHKKWKYKDDICVGCEKKSETFEEIISCPGLMEPDEVVEEEISHNIFLGGSVEDMERIAKILKKRLKRREKILEDKT